MVATTRPSPSATRQRPVRAMVATTQLELTESGQLPVRSPRIQQHHSHGQHYWATAVAGAVADDAGCVLSDLASKKYKACHSSQRREHLQRRGMHRSISECGRGRSHGGRCRSQHPDFESDITNIIEAGESGSCSVEATANVDYATAVAAGINIRNSNVGGDFTNHVVADAITASATALDPRRQPAESPSKIRMSAEILPTTWSPIRSQQRLREGMIPRR